MIHHITSVALDETKNNIPITIPQINDTIVNGQSLGLGGYLDIGLIDTIKDLFVNFIGAVVFSILGFFYIKSRGGGWIAKEFIPRMKSKRADFLAQSEAMEEDDD